MSIVDSIISTAKQPTRTAAAKKPPRQQADEIESSAQNALRRSSYPALRRVSCDYCNGAVWLRGVVPSFFMKQVAQSVVQGRLNDAVPIVNRLKVR